MDMWCEIVGCDSVTWSCTSQAHMPTPLPMEHWPFCLSSRRIFSRAGSATALSASTSCLSERGIVLIYTERLIWVNVEKPTTEARRDCQNCQNCQNRRN